jgi:hypothetical protein
MFIVTKALLSELVNCVYCVFIHICIHVLCLLCFNIYVYHVHCVFIHICIHSNKIKKICNLLCFMHVCIDNKNCIMLSYLLLTSSWLTSSWEAPTHQWLTSSWEAPTQGKQTNKKNKICFFLCFMDVCIHQKKPRRSLYVLILYIS